MIYNWCSESFQLKGDVGCPSLGLEIYEVNKLTFSNYHMVFKIDLGNWWTGTYLFHILLEPSKWVRNKRFTKSFKMKENKIIIPLRIPE